LVVHSIIWVLVQNKKFFYVVALWSIVLAYATRISASTSGAGKLSYTPNVRQVACDDVTISRALLFLRNCIEFSEFWLWTIKIVLRGLTCNYTAPQVTDSCQFQLYDINKCKFLNYQPWENLVAKGDDLESGHYKIISTVLKNTSSLFNFSVFNDNL